MHRPFSVLICLTAAASLIIQFLVSAELMGFPGTGAVLWQMAGYFTVLTNTLVAATFLSAVIWRRKITAVWGGGLTLWICAVGIVYHLVLATLWSPEGPACWADQGLHSAVPVLVLVWWLTIADRSGLRSRHAVLWLIWPMLYCAYALIRGAATGFYPYPFLDVAALGIGSVGVNITGLVLAFWLGGLGLVALSRRMAAIRIS